MIKSYVVYKHTFPNGKVYIGLTGAKIPTSRWGTFGNKYKEVSQPNLARAIQKYSWENVQHEIIASGLTKEDACALEIKLIAEHNSTNYEFGYNSTTGGEYAAHSEESKLKASLSNKGQVPWMKGKCHSDKTKEKMSIAHTGVKRAPRSEVHKKNLSKALTGRKLPPFSEEHRARISAAQKGVIRGPRAGKVQTKQ